MNENQFEQLVAQMLTAVKTATDWTIETQRREIEEHDRKLAAAQAVLRKALDFVSRERERIRGPDAGQQENLRRLHDEMAPRELPKNPNPHPVPQQQVKGKPF